MPRCGSSLDRRRDSEARIAAEALLSRSESSAGSACGHYTEVSTTLLSDEVKFAVDEADKKWCGVMTACRRTFCLVVTFDLIMIFILWGVYVKVTSDAQKISLIVALEEEIRCDFTKSLFDAVLCSMFRFVLLISAYAVFRIRNPSVIAVTTFLTCVYVIVKLFLISGRPPVSYVLLVSSFLIVWIETLLLDFKVLPREQRLREQWDAFKSSREHEREEERTRLVQEEELTFHTPDTWSPVVSHQSPRQNYGAIASQFDNELRKKAEEAWRQAHRLFAVEDGWSRVTFDRAEESGITVYSQHVERYGKLYKLEASVPASPTKVFEETVRNIETALQWNPTVLEYRILDVIDASTDIAYNVTAPAGGGMVSSRDFVTLRHWKVSGDVILSSGVSIEHPSMPPTKHYVRGENRLAGWEFRPVQNESNLCRLRMIVSTDIKGWIPQRVVDMALTGVLVDFVRYLQARVASLPS